MSRYQQADDNDDPSLHDLFSKVRNLMKTNRSSTHSKSSMVIIDNKSGRKPFQDITQSINTDNLRNKSKNKIDKTPSLKSIATKLEIRINELMSIDTGFENYHDMMNEYRLQQKQLHQVILSDYMIEIQRNNCLTWNHRRLLIDWLISVQLEYDFSNLTLFTAINYIDCYLSKKQVSDWRSVHTLAVGAIYVASKTIEIIPLRLNDCTIISDNLYSHSSITRMEKILLDVIDWNVFIFTPYSFIRCWLNVLININNKNKQRIMEKYMRFISFGIHSFSMNKQYLSMDYFDVVSYLIYLASFQKEIRDKTKTNTIDIELLMLVSDNNDLLKKIKTNYYKSVNDAMLMVIKPSNKREEECTHSIREKYNVSRKYGDNVLSLIKNLKID